MSNRDCVLSEKLVEVRGGHNMTFTDCSFKTDKPNALQFLHYVHHVDFVAEQNKHCCKSLPAMLKRFDKQLDTPRGCSTERARDGLTRSEREPFLVFQALCYALAAKKQQIYKHIARRAMRF